MPIFDDTGLEVINGDASDETDINDLVARLVTALNTTVENRLVILETGQPLAVSWATENVGVLIEDNSTGTTISGYSAFAWKEASKGYATNAQGITVISADGTDTGDYSAKAYAEEAKAWASGTGGVPTEADGSTVIPYSANEKATAAANSATSAAESEASATELMKLYLGGHEVPPTTDNEGEPLQEGALYWNTIENIMYVWIGSAWVEAATIKAYVDSEIKRITKGTPFILAFGGGL